MPERILETADRLFYGQGLRAVGVDTIAAEIGISKRTLYNHFPSKDALMVAYLQRRLRLVPTSTKPPGRQILDDFERLERAFGSDGFQGCAFVNAVAELKDPRHAANEIALAFKEMRRQWFRELLKRAQVADPEGLSLQLMLLVDGAIAAALVRRDPTVARAAGTAARTLLAAAGLQPVERRIHENAGKPDIEGQITSILVDVQEDFYERILHGLVGVGCVPQVLERNPNGPSLEQRHQGAEAVPGRVTFAGVDEPLDLGGQDRGRRGVGGIVRARRPCGSEVDDRLSRHCYGCWGWFRLQ